ncbi:MAG: hypothetical protein LBJ02_00145 [Bifidobacteriaceae bacterium]|jgi:LmbE family N-acetylglucosaminyl deacetylase|nr:hypothetical protein [Bifidobacteriaceae bacterium]
MSLAPGYGETPLDFEELDALLPVARKLIGEPVTKAAVYDHEEGIAEHVGADAGVHLHVLRRILGHQSIEATKAYLHPDHRHLADAAKQADRFFAQGCAPAARAQGAQPLST